MAHIFAYEEMSVQKLATAWFPLPQQTLGINKDSSEWSKVSP